MASDAYSVNGWPVEPLQVVLLVDMLMLGERQLDVDFFPHRHLVDGVAMRSSLHESSTSCPSVLITAASSGIGKATAIAFAREGAVTILAARREGTLRAVAEEIESAGGKAFVAPVDVSSPEQVRCMVADVVALWEVPGLEWDSRRPQGSQSERRFRH